MPRGKKKSHKGAHRHFTNEDDLALQAEKVRKEQEWRSMKGLPSNDDGDENNDSTDESKKKNDDGITTGETVNDDDDDSGDEGDESEDEDNKPKGISHLIEIENPNRVPHKSKKVDAVQSNTTATHSGQSNDKPGLSRREREEIEKQQAKDRYQKMHEAGKTEEARADLARLALIKKQREEAMKKRDQEKLAQEEAKSSVEKKKLEKKAQGV